MKNFNVFTILLLVLIPFLNSCCKKCQDPSNPDCENYDPCFSEKPVSASFKIFETASGPVSYWKDYETDTVGSSYPKFVADIKDAEEYEWIIGAKTYNGKSVSLSFIGVPDKSVIPITLIVKKKPNKDCNPNDDGVDTVTRNMVIANECKLFSVFEKYRFHGSFTDSPKDTFTMSFYRDTTFLSYPTVIEPLIKEYRFYERSGVTFGYRQVEFSSDDTPSYKGRAFLKPNDSLEVNFEYYLPLTEPKKLKTFLGKKVR
jgi:hypothetical protein